MSESGECEVRVSVPGRVIIDCECQQKSANRQEDEDTRREQAGGRPRPNEQNPLTFEERLARLEKAVFNQNH